MSTERANLNPRQRARALRSLAERTFDLVVVGGGITGVGTALDAVSRGLSVALVEQGDWASGTSSRSGKVFHGGLRYLEQLNFSLVREALRERDLMVDRLCPHLAKPEPFVFPFRRRRERPYVGAGVLLYDLLRMTGTRSVPGHRHLTRAGVHRELPGLRPDTITGGVLFHDVRVDDARHTLTVARTAADLGAQLASRVLVTGLLVEGGVVRGVRARDLDGGTGLVVRARAVVNATGVWAAQVQAMSGRPTISVTPSKGVHLVVPGDRFEGRAGLIAKTDDSIFLIRRWFGFWLMGTTDTRWEHDRDDPAATRADTDYLLGQANRWLRRPLRDADVIGVYAGLRPLVSGRTSRTAGLSRDHSVLTGPPGLTTVVGGKYTTYRIMARDAVDAATAAWAQTVPPSETERLPILGASGYSALLDQRRALAAETGLKVSRIDHLLGRYGTLTPDLLDLMADRPEWARPVTGASHYLTAELHYAARNEGAVHLDDVLERRTRIFMETPDRGLAAAPYAADVLAEELGWDDDRRAAEVARYRSAREADRRALAAASDDDAVNARRSLRS
ncbi:glycerol-3-phosphate dehydrogenase/oxidase [Amycolatopsis rhabdoformis]|uniref:Glycerol-3-phosphate dehydrogenase n=1 Tax=Amycolatopsis rhabdoformis TaxID=1448059 RepID=A0ABZ1IIN9_9PSEU|nr:glycerol-3-phosphate dehydrogenase/oxidase [Amycolatopsis rhabdoformis]WSE34117.1 glycerol-3-phosphate dehydrogenase/oxidase [Amycolatopsis rhabdoformis]